MDGPRVARPDELPAIIELVEHVFGDSRGRPHFMARMFPHFLSAANLENMYVVADGDRLASFLGVDRQTFITAGCRLPAALIGAVCTHEDYAGRRLSGQTLRLALERSRRQGALLAWISGARTVYQAAGAECVWPLRRFEVAGDRLAALTDAALDIAPLSPDDLGPLLELQAREVVRFEWTSTWIDGVLRPTLERRNVFTYLVRRQGRTVAAAGLSTWHRSDGGADLLDWFGDRRAVVGSLGRLAEAVGVLNVMCYFVAGGLMAEAAAAADLPAVPRTDWTLKVLDFAGLVAALGPHLARSLGREAGALAATADGLRVRTGGADYVTSDERLAARIIFSPPADWPAAAAVPEPVRALLARAFPVPLRHYGLNYI